ncbi:MAG: hypothetical protein FJW39_27285 [Acidobacteria bacterium]|nr:hypothetical protein [Acidobacteriota bacterium]
MYPRKLMIAAVVAAGVLGAQELSGPVSGLVFDEQAKAVRVIAGVPGAAYLGSSLAEGDEGSISPDGNFAVVRQGAELMLLKSGGGAVRLGAAEGVTGEVAWSADSHSVAVESRSIRLWINLDTQPEQSPLARFEGDAISLAVSGRGVAAGAKGGVFVLNSEGSRLIVPADEPEGLAISGGTLYVADLARKEVLAVRNFASAPEIALIANEAAGVGAPVAVAADNGSLLIADAGRKLVAMSLSTGETQYSLELDFVPARLDRFARGLYRLNVRDSATDPVQILQLGSEPAVFFVPAAAASRED